MARSPAAAHAFSLEPYSYAEARALMDGLGLAEPVAVTLVRRGYRSVETARAFLAAEETHDPLAFEGMAEAVQRLRAAIAAGRRITVHGDYDVDGVCSTAILVGTLRELGADCDWHIPDRLGDGYGLTRDTVEQLAGRGTALLLTADCGIGSVDEVVAARRAGLEVIVTDHHQPGATLPDCPILHPVVSGYPCEELCATGVAHKLACALAGTEIAERDLDLVALATVADMVPLRGENRSLVRRGIALARQARRPGLRALMAVARVNPARLDEGDFAFRLAPRVNAAGRLYRADAGVELMLTEDEDRADAIATELDAANRERRAAEDAVLEGAESARRALDEALADGPALVLAEQGWHAGVIGIVASRLVERHLVPVVLIGLGDDGRGRGSGRSVAGFDLLGGLAACEEHLLRYGGHRAAAGLEIEATAVPAFREAFVAHVAAAMEAGPAVPADAIDAIVGGEGLGIEVAQQLEQLAPFGMGNPGVRLLVPGARLRDVRPMGEGDRHARFLLQSGSRSATGVAFGVNGSLAGAGVDDGVDVSLRLEVNRWNGTVEPRVVLGEVYPGPGTDAPGELPELSPQEWLVRLEAELVAPLAAWPPGRPGGQTAREVIDRRGHSGVATVAALVSSGESVLVLCADALRRRELVERAAAPARFGGGTVAIASGRLADDHLTAGPRALGGLGGVLLADWGALARATALASGFRHVVVIDPPPFAHLEALAGTGGGYLHQCWSDPELALRVHAGEWPSRDSLAFRYRAVDRAAEAGRLDPARARRALCGDGQFPHPAEVAARHLRVLLELGLVRWEGSSTDGVLWVVSSEGTDLELSDAYAAYRERHREGERYLNSRTRTS